MEEQNKKQSTPSSPSTSLETEAEKFWRELQEMPWSTDKVGQGFCMPYSKPRDLKQPATDKKDPEKEV